MLRAAVGDRRNRRHKPGRGFERTQSRVDVLCDYGAFRDLQRHRMLTVQWQRLGPHLGAEVPDELDAAGVGDAFRHGLEVSRAEWERLAGEGWFLWGVNRERRQAADRRVTPRSTPDRRMTRQ